MEKGSAFELGMAGGQFSVTPATPDSGSCFFLLHLP